MDTAIPLRQYTVSARKLLRVKSQPVYYELDFNTNIFDRQFVTGLGEKISCPVPAPTCSREDDPLQWSPAKKNLHLIFACLSVTCSSYAPSSYSPASEQMAAEWGIRHIAVMCGIFSFTMGFALSPMFLAPFSELVGRRPVILASGGLFLVSSLCCSFTQHFYGMILARFFAGFGSSTFSMGNGLITDIYAKENRNTPMAIFAGVATLGIGLGAFVSGFIAEYTSWRWIFASQSMFLALCLAMMTCFLSETRSNVLLIRKCALWNKWMEGQESKQIFVLDPGNKETKIPATLSCARWKPRTHGDETEKSFKHMIKDSITLPFQMLVKDEILLPVSLWAAFSWSVLYVCLSAVMKMFEERYGFTVSQSNSMFALECLGAIVAIALGIWKDHWMKSWADHGQPEDRLYFARVECLLLPIGLLVFGWSGEQGAPWWIPAGAMGLATVGITLVYLAVFNYLADAYGRHASTAIAAQSFVRNGMCGCFPLFTTQMFAALGYGWGSTIFASIGLVLCALPWLLKRHGPRLRLRSKYAASPEASRKGSFSSERFGDKHCVRRNSVVAEV